MLTNEEKLELFDELLRDALTLAKALQEQVTAGGFSDLRTAWKNVHAVRSLRDDAHRLLEADQPAAIACDCPEAPQGIHKNRCDIGGPWGPYRKRKAETAPQGAPERPTDIIEGIQRKDLGRE